jgi:hypothetical protein
VLKSCVLAQTVDGSGWERRVKFGVKIKGKINCAIHTDYSAVRPRTFPIRKKSISPPHLWGLDYIAP